MIDVRKLEQALSSLPSRYKLILYSGRSGKIVCPFHKDKDPSLIININARNSNGLPIGVFHCLGCGEKGHWNKLAEKTGMPKVDDAYQEDPIPIEKRTYSANKDNGLKALIKDWNVTDIKPIKNSWRNISKKVLSANRALEGMRFGLRCVLLPVRIRGEMVGAVLARDEKHEKYPSYLNSEGAWTKDFGLLGYENAIRIIRKKNLKAIVLVEGPRDALYCQMKGIPAVALLGTRNISEDKFKMITYYVDVDKVILLLDGDKAGRKASKDSKSLLKGSFKVVEIKLWHFYLDKKGKMKNRVRGKKYSKSYNVDPATLPDKYMDKILKLCKS